jgi:hypothetical protein
MVYVLSDLHSLRYLVHKKSTEICNNAPRFLYTSTVPTIVCDLFQAVRVLRIRIRIDFSHVNSDLGMQKEN